MYTVYQPFHLPEDRAITSLEVPFEGTFQSYPCRLASRGHYYALNVEGLPTEEKALECLLSIQAGLLWTAADKNIGVMFSFETQSVKYTADPTQTGKNLAASFGDGTGFEPVDALIDASRPAVYLTGKEVKVLVLSPVTISLEVPADQVVAVADYGAKSINASSVLNNPKISLALDILCLSYFQPHGHARFLTQFIVMEVLTPSRRRSDRVIALLDEFVHTVDAEMSELDNFVQRKELEVLRNQLGNLRTTSKTSGMREFTESVLRADGNTDGRRLASKIPELYDVRSRLLHDGKIELGNAQVELQSLVSNVLKAVMRNPELVDSLAI